MSRRKPDLIILDLTLPDCSGIEFIKKIKQLSPQVKILVLTIHEEEDYIQKVLRGRKWLFIKKAADDELILAIRAIMWRNGCRLFHDKKLWQRYLQPAEKHKKAKQKICLVNGKKRFLSWLPAALLTNR